MQIGVGFLVRKTCLGLMDPLWETSTISFEVIVSLFTEGPLGLVPLKLAHVTPASPLSFKVMLNISSCDFPLKEKRTF